MFYFILYQLMFYFISSNAFFMIIDRNLVNANNPELVCFFVEYKICYFNCFNHFVHTMKVNGVQNINNIKSYWLSGYEGIILCLNKRKNAYRLGTTWGWKYIFE